MLSKIFATYGNGENVSKNAKKLGALAPVLLYIVKYTITGNNSVIVQNIFSTLFENRLFLVVPCMLIVALRSFLLVVFVYRLKLL